MADASLAMWMRVLSRSSRVSPLAACSSSDMPIDEYACGDLLVVLQLAVVATVLIPVAIPKTTLGGCPPDYIRCHGLASRHRGQ